MILNTKPIGLCFKVGLSLQKNCVICLIESSLKMMKNVFHFVLKSFFVLNVFKFCHDILAMYEKQPDLKDSQLQNS